MRAFLRIFIWLSVISVRQTFGAERTIKKGIIADWFYTSVDTGLMSSSQWDRDAKMFESNDIMNGAWLVTNPVTLSDVVNYHLRMDAKITSCVAPGNKICSLLDVYNFTGMPPLDIPPTSDSAGKKKAQNYLLKNFKKLHSLTFSNKIETKSFNFSYNGNKIRFAIRARGNKGELHNIALYYYYCEKTIISGVQLTQSINAPAQGWKSVRANCTSNAVSKYNETNFEGRCWYNGTWSIGSGCLCRPGYGMPRRNQAHVGCTKCQERHFKPNLSNEPCLPCPARSTSDSKNTECNCVKDAYRLPSQAKDNTAPCYSVPSKVRNMKIRVGDVRGTVYLSWDPPHSVGEMTSSLKYDVDCFDPCIDVTFTPRKDNLTKPNVQISRLSPGRRYNFKVFSKNNVSELLGRVRSTFNNITYDVPKSHAVDEVMFKTEYKIAAAVCGFIILILAIALVYTCRRKHIKHNKRTVNDYGGITLPEIGQKMYIDPSNYEDAETAVHEFANEIDPASVALERLIGGGEFGDVYKGTLMMQDGNVIAIAAKTLKANASEKNCRDFFLEASAMGQFDDPNVIHLQGVITRVEPKMILTEFMSNGSLDHFLTKNDGGLRALQLFGIACDVASGMRYLASINFVHRDLAARNILVDENIFCKVADFGLSRELETEDSSRGEYFTTGGKIPVRWTAPEAIKYRKFSTASDVWSYGILLWEIMTFAQRPYWDWGNFTVMERVEKGYRLPPPVNCPQAVHGLMLKCWEYERNQRPTFENIIKTIDEWIESPESLHKPNMRERSNQLPCSAPSTSVKEWLEEIKMTSYMPKFAAAGYEQLADLAGLLDNDLKDLGVSLVGHRNKMLRTIRSLPVTKA